MNLKKMNESEFKKMLIKNLKKFGVNAIDLGERATFDLIIEGTRQYIVELKKCTPDYSTHMQERGFDFTISQHKEIEKMKFPPVVIGYDDKGCYWFAPSQVKKGVTDRHGYLKDKLAARFRTPYFKEFLNPISFEDLLQKIVRFVRK